MKFKQLCAALIAGSFILPNAAQAINEVFDSDEGRVFAAQSGLTVTDAQSYLEAIKGHPDANSYLVDFDSNGSEELVLVWPYGKDFSGSCYEVYSGNTRLVAEEYDMIAVALYQKDGKQGYYIGESPTGGDISALITYTLSDGRWSKIDAITGSVVLKPNYKINGTNVSKQEYDNARNAYKEVTALYEYNEKHSVEQQLTQFIADSSSGPDTHGEFNGHTYCVFDLHSDWKTAKEYCESLGGHLATITSKEENDFLYGFMKESGYQDAFFGFTDEVEEGNWQWVTGESVSYTNWKDGEPNNDQGSENYAMFYHNYTDQWNDWNFGEVTAFICEWDQLVTQQQGDTVQSPSSFSDVPANAWYFPAVERAEALGFVTGYEDNTFKPENSISRAESITLISRFCKDQIVENISGIGFDDVANDAWYAKTVLLRGHKFGGVSNGFFYPDMPCSREDFSVGLYYALGFEGQDWSYSFKDISQISSDKTYRNAALSMGANGIMTGDSHGNFNPKKNITRAEAAQIFCNMVDASIEGIPITDPFGVPADKPNDQPVKPPYTDVLPQMSQSDINDLFNLFAGPLGVMNENAIAKLSDQELIQSVFYRWVDGGFPIKNYGATDQTIGEVNYFVYSKSDFEDLVRLMHNRNVDLNQFECSVLPSSLGEALDTNWPGFLYGDKFYLFIKPLSPSSIPRYDPKYLYKIAENTYCAVFEFWYCYDGEQDYNFDNVYSAIIEKNSDSSWTLLKRYDGGYQPTNYELMKFVTKNIKYYR